MAIQVIKVWIAAGATIFVLGFLAHLALFKYEQHQPATNVHVVPTHYHVGPLGP